MMMEMFGGPAPANPEMLELARLARGRTQSELVKPTGISQTKLSKAEAGIASLNPAELQALAKELRFPESFFRWNDRTYGLPPQELFHRRRQSVSARVLRAIEANFNIFRMRVARLLKATEIDAATFIRLDPDDYQGDLASIARAVRAAWALPSGPIRNLTATIEAAGGIVVPSDFTTSQVDAVSFWPVGMPPLFFVNLRAPMDRLRWTLAHEIGHLTMHQAPGSDAEREADEFAAAFLMPADQIIDDLRGVTLTQIAHLKRVWKVSMQALLRRAESLGTVTPTRARSMWMDFSKLGYRKVEPYPVEHEEPALFRALIELHRSELNYSHEDLVELLGDLNPEQYFRPGDTRLISVI